MALASHEEPVLVLDQLCQQRLIGHALIALRHFTLHKIDQRTQGALCFSFSYLLHRLLKSTPVREVVLNVWSVRWCILIDKLRVYCRTMHRICDTKFWLSHAIHGLKRQK